MYFIITCTIVVVIVNIVLASMYNNTGTDFYYAAKPTSKPSKPPSKPSKPDGTKPPPSKPSKPPPSKPSKPDGAKPPSKPDGTKPPSKPPSNRETSRRVSIGVSQQLSSIPPLSQRPSDAIYTKDPKTGKYTTQSLATQTATYQGKPVPVLTLGGSFTGDSININLMGGMGISAILVNGKPVYGTVTNGKFIPSSNQSQVAQNNPTLTRLMSGPNSNVQGFGSQAAKDVAKFVTGPQVVSIQDKIHTVSGRGTATFQGKPVQTIVIDGNTFANINGKLYTGSVTNGAFNGIQISLDKRRDTGILGLISGALVGGGAAVGGVLGGPLGAAAGGAGGAAIASFIAGTQIGKGQTTNKPPVTANAKPSDISPNTSYSVYDDKTNSVKVYNATVENGKVVYSECDPTSRSLMRNCAKNVVNAVPAVWSGIMTQIRDRGPVQILQDFSGSLSNLSTEAAKLGLSYYDYMQNVATYFPTETPKPYSEYLGEVVAMSSVAGGLYSSATGSSGKLFTTQDCINKCISVGKGSLFDCGFRCRMISG